MQRVLVGSAFALVLTIGAAFSLPSDASARKCRPGRVVRFPDAPEPGYVLDGKQVTEAEMKALADVSPDTIESIEIVCADDAYAVYGAKARANVIVMFTTPGPKKRLRAALDSLAVLQQRHLAANGSFAATIEALGWSDSTGLITVDITVADDGSRWSATGKHRHILDRDFALSIAGDESGTVSPPR